MPEAHLISPSGRVWSPISPGQDRCFSVPVLDRRIWAMRCLPLTRLRPTTSTLRFSVMVLRVPANAAPVLALALPVAAGVLEAGGDGESSFGDPSHPTIARVSTALRARLRLELGEASCHRK